jgi:NADP-dependent 3-hydroxy acid dehydrogenase YdfG
MGRRRPPKAVFITGASSGIGRALAIEYARRGSRVAVTARREVELAELAREIEAAGGKAIPYVLDVRDEAATRDVLARADQEIGPLEMVIANAGVASGGLAQNMTWPDIERVLDINAKGAICTIMCALPVFLSHGRGHLVAVSSLAGRVGLPRSSVYSASKAAVSTFLQSLRVDLRSTRVSVTDIQAGFVKTPMVAGSRFPRPFEWSAERAAAYMADRLEKRPAVVSFQLPHTALSALARVLPHAVYDLVAPMLVK